MSTDHDTSMEKPVTIQKGGQQRDIQKPMCVLDYTNHMAGSPEMILTMVYDLRNYLPFELYPSSPF
jgi:hypothetical protein